MELLAPLRGEQVREVLGGDRTAPPIPRAREEAMGLAELQQLARVIVSAPRLGKMVERPRLPPDITEDRELPSCLLQERPSSTHATRVALGSSQREQRPGRQAPVAELMADGPGLGGVRDGFAVPPHLDQALRPAGEERGGGSRVDAFLIFLDDAKGPLVQSLGGPRLVGEGLRRRPTEIPNREPSGTDRWTPARRRAPELPGPLVMMGERGDGLLGRRRGTSPQPLRDLEVTAGPVP